MNKPKDEHARQNEVRRQKAAELIALQLRKRQRDRTDEALISAVGASEDPEKPPKKRPGK